MFDWSPLRDALAQCRCANVAVPLWWRDDDAIAMTQALQHLTDLSVRTQMPVHLAIIPAHVDPYLPQDLEVEHVLPVVHGWAHRDHSDPGSKKNEFLTPRPGVEQDIEAGWVKMRTLFGSALRPMFVPPWNRISAQNTGFLAAQGYRAVSTYGARGSRSVSDLDVVNTHVDPIWWRGNRDLVDPATLIANAATELRARARGTVDQTEPFGLLTHHLVHTPAIWSFAEAFLTEMQLGGATPWSMENET